MKNWLFGLVVILCLCSVVLAEENSYEKTVAALTPQQVLDESKLEEKLIIPPVGTPVSQIAAVYGEPKQIEPGIFEKGSTRKYTAYRWDLLPLKGNVDFRAFLWMPDPREKANYISIYHACVLNGREAYPKDSELGKKEAKEIEAENRNMLIDLMEIHAKYRTQLANASWNERKSLVPVKTQEPPPIPPPAPLH